MTTMCLQYKPTVVACVCIYIVCTWSHYEIQRVTEGKDWFWYVDKTVTLELLQSLTAEFLAILDKCPNRLKKIMNSSQHTDDRGKGSQPGSSSTVPSSRSIAAVGGSSAVSSRGHDHNSHNKTGLKVPPAQPHQHQQPPKLNLKEYNEKREKERREREKMRDRDVVDPRDKQFALVATSHSSQAVSTTVASIATSHSALHSSLPIRTKSGKSSSGRSSHPEHVKASAVHSSNHKTHGHGATQVARDSQPSLESLRVSVEAPRQEQRRDISARSDSERYDKGSRTSSVVDSRLTGVDIKPSVSDIRQQQMLDIKPSRQSLDSSLIERKKEIKLEQKTAERKPPEPKQEQVKIKTDIKTEIKAEPKEEVKSQYNTIFNNSNINEYDLIDYRNENSLRNLSDEPPEELFDNSDTETKPDISAILEDNSLLPPPVQQKSKSPVSCQQQVGHQAQHQQHPSSGLTATNISGVSGNGDQRVSENVVTATAPNYHSARHHHTSTNGSVPAPPPAQITPQSLKSSNSRRSRDGERRNSERGEAELVPVVTKLEDTRYRTVLSDPGTPVKVRPEAPNVAAANSTSKPPAQSYSTPSAVNSDSVQKNTSEPVLRVKVPQPEHMKEPQADPTPGAGTGNVVAEQKKHRHEYPHHKHKEKKKHKHKEKDKHKDREHKEHKREKKHKKHKDREKEKEKLRSNGDGGTGPIKITIAKDKILYTPESASVPLRTHTTTTPTSVTVPTTTASTTPGIPKFKIHKSRFTKKDLFGGTSSTSPESSPAGDLTRDTPTTSLKIKISRERLRPDKESRKRDRDHSPGDVHAAKISRSGSEARPTHVAPQVPIKDLDPSRWSSQRQ
ncbi:uncharacterized protein CycT isoform X2 [Panulirus ornatus]